MNNNLLLKAAHLVLFIGFILIARQTAIAQCPTGWIPKATSFQMILPCDVLPITVTVTYCVPGPSVGPSTQYHIRKIDFSPTCAITPEDIRRIGKELIIQNPEGWDCSPICPDLNPEYSISWEQCGIEALNQTNSSWTACEGGTGGCIDLYHVCCDCGPDGVCGTGDDVLNPTLVGANASLGDCGEGLPAECKPFCPGIPKVLAPEKDPGAEDADKDDLLDLSYREEG